MNVFPWEWSDILNLWLCRVRYVHEGQVWGAQVALSDEVAADFPSAFKILRKKLINEALYRLREDIRAL